MKRDTRPANFSRSGETPMQQALLTRDVRLSGAIQNGSRQPIIEEWMPLSVI
jgi:hypothetical protein